MIQVGYLASLVIGCTKIFQLEDLSKSVKVKKSDEDIKYLENYINHIL